MYAKTFTPPCKAPERAVPQRLVQKMLEFRGDCASKGVVLPRVRGGASAGVGLCCHLILWMWCVRKPFWNFGCLGHSSQFTKSASLLGSPGEPRCVFIALSLSETSGPRAPWKNPSHECLRCSYHVAGYLPDSPRVYLLLHVYVIVLQLTLNKHICEWQKNGKDHNKWVSWLKLRNSGWWVGRWWKVLNFRVLFWRKAVKHQWVILR